MKHINIRDDNDGKPKVGTYQHVRQQTITSRINQIEKRTITKPKNPTSKTSVVRNATSAKTV